ncbi:MAG: hypothetical protein HC850_07550 [Rhodomicrobium sp.]|nr:hypothetical protein [Rhodomicrobium sp.]
MFARLKPKIEFLCDPADHGVISEPMPAKNVIPDWFRKLPPVDKAHVSATDNGLTIKRCMPFLDAMTAGWIIPLAATVRLEISDAGHTVNAGWEIDRVMVSNHNPSQIAGHPLQPRPPCKFHNYWTIKTPPGWSCLFVPPINRHNPVVEVLSGIVDSDTYRSLINFPFLPIAADGVYTLEKGTPLVQVIPFRRESTHIEGVVRVETKADMETRERILRLTQASEGWYRQVARAKR